MPIEGLRISDVTATGKGGLRAHHTVGLELRNVRMDAEEGPAFLIRDSTDLELDGVSTGRPCPGVRWSDWTGARTRWCGGARRSPGRERFFRWHRAS